VFWDGGLGLGWGWEVRFGGNRTLGGRLARSCLMAVWGWLFVVSLAQVFEEFVELLEEVGEGLDGFVDRAEEGGE
jgi:hypothetical protein